MIETRREKLLAMKPNFKKTQLPLVLLTILLPGAFLALLVIVTNSKIASANSSTSVTMDGNSRRQRDTCVDGVAKIPAEVSSTLLHFATTSEIPQQSKSEVSLTLDVLLKRGPCNFLVIGLWHDSLLWATFNYGGRTVFLDESQEWIDRTRNNHPQLATYKVDYTTTLEQAAELLDIARRKRSTDCRPHQPVVHSTCPLALSKQLPRELLEVQWDVIMIDGPRSYKNPKFPGRMSAIFTAAIIARTRTTSGYTDIFVHDISRPVENQFSREFLCSSNLVETAGDLWHFQIHPTSYLAPDFCPQASASASQSQSQSQSQSS